MLTFWNSDEILQFLGIHHGWFAIEGAKTNNGWKHHWSHWGWSGRGAWKLDVETFHFYLSRMWNYCSFAQQWIMFNAWHQSNFLAAKLEGFETVSQVASLMCCTCLARHGRLNHSVHYKNLKEIWTFWNDARMSKIFAQFWRSWAMAVTKDELLAKLSAARLVEHSTQKSGYKRS